MNFDSQLTNLLKDSQEDDFLNLAKWNIGNKGVEVLSKKLEEYQDFIDLNLSENEISDEGAISLSNSIRKGNLLKLTDLDLTSNKIGGKGAEALSSALEKCPELGMLDLSENEIGDKGAIAFSKAMKEGYCQNLELFYLGDNNISNKGAKALIEGVKSCKCPNLEDLALDDVKINYKIEDPRNVISNEVKEKLREALEYIKDGGCVNMFNEVPESDSFSESVFSYGL